MESYSCSQNHNQHSFLLPYLVYKSETQSDPDPVLDGGQLAWLGGRIGRQLLVELPDLQLWDPVF